MLACVSGAADEPAYTFVQHGKASFYANSLAGGVTASGERYHPDSLTAAHQHLPLGTRVVVINPANQQEVMVTINDRGPHRRGRIIDLSRRAAGQLGIMKAGVAPVIVKAALPQSVADSLSRMIKYDEGDQ